MLFSHLKNDVVDDSPGYNHLKNDLINHINKSEKVSPFELYKNEVDHYMELIMMSDNLDDLQESFSFFNFFLVENDLIFPPLILNKLLFLISNHQNQNIGKLLKLIRLTTSFDSPMQDFYVENQIFNLLHPYFPHEEVINTYANLSLKSPMFREFLLNSNILTFILQNINNEQYFECLINLTKALLYKIDDFSYENFNRNNGNDFVIRLFIELFNFLIFRVGSDEKTILIVGAFRDFIEADIRFLDYFISQNFLRIFLKYKTNDLLYIRTVLRICDIMFCKNGEVVHYLLSLNILDWIHSIIFVDNQEIRSLSFQLLYDLVDYHPSITDDLIRNDMHVFILPEFSGKASIRYKRALYKFSCILLQNITTEFLDELISNKIIDIIIHEISLIDADDDDSVLVLDAILKLQQFLEHDAVHDIIYRIKHEEEFTNWILDAAESENETVADTAYIVKSFLEGIEEEET
ncbi:hypothetical protein TRFO_15204 [Tritrichomonas foetus]|uniref:SPIN90/Ldb17 leucine-rich domain-containing protein n=1 Tax=Tritrichomonas foetus TaxID=1144522 RepID=A0A1J4KU40_9EUKA|nr:hypothetical protein TRFO_15204 [Tritrichomonas foetus]|eukprot:OHT14424.1 hypothetical protein TRFO_15204 [Tritrichomonas foetus]